MSTRYVSNSHFRPSADMPDVCKDCRAPFDAHYNGQCPVDENEDEYNRDLALRIKNKQVGSGMKLR